MKRRSRAIEVLLVEDNPADVALTIEGFAETKIRNRVQAVNDGKAALRYLRQQGEYVEAIRPDLILLDLNLPRLDGREVLAEIKGDQALKVMPVIILSSSRAEKDVFTSYQLYANGYIRKPVGFDQLCELVNAIDQFWFQAAELPPQANEL